MTAPPDPARPASTGPASPGTCFGFEVHSNLPFHFLRTGPGAPLTVEETGEDLSREPGRLLQTWDAIPGRRTRIEIYDHPDGHRVQIGEDTPHWFHIPTGRDSILVSGTPDPVYREMLLWTTPITITAFTAGLLPLHSAAVDLGGAAVLLVAPSRSGKTTTAMGFHNMGYRLLSEDLTCVRPDDAQVLPGPALIKIRRDMASRFEMESAQPVMDTPQKIHYSFEGPARGTADPVPLRAIVFLGVHDGSLELEDVAPADALRDLWATSFYLPDNESRGRCFDQIGRLLTDIPAQRLSRRLDEEALWSSVELIARTHGD